MVRRKALLIWLLTLALAASCAAAGQPTAIQKKQFSRAVIEGNLDAVTRLLKASPSLAKAKDNMGATALHWAADKDRRAVAELLLNTGAAVNAQKNDGVSPLHIAAALGRMEITQLLLSSGASATLEDNRCRTPLSVAEDNHRDAIAMLLDARIDESSTFASAKLPDRCRYAQGSSDTAWIWAKGNLHTHTTASDGHGTAENAVRWYRDHGYRFLVISDHGVVVQPAKVKVDGLVFVPGEEVTSKLHVNGLGVRHVVKTNGLGFSRTTPDVLRGITDRIRAAGGIPMLNHPGDPKHLKVDDLLPVRRHYLMELNWDPPALEPMWDSLLSSGLRVWATMTDDAHCNYIGNVPGGRFVSVRVKTVSVPDILAALDRGDFYTSSGVELSDVSFEDNVLSISVRSKPNVTYTVQFIGKGCRVLSKTNGATAQYQLTNDADAGYVRAKVTCNDGTMAYTQPVWPLPDSAAQAPPAGS